MNYHKLKEFSKIAAGITAAIDALMENQSLLVDLMLKECDIPCELKDDILKDMRTVVEAYQNDAA